MLLMEVMMHRAAPEGAEVETVALQIAAVAPQPRITSMHSAATAHNGVS